MNKRPSGVTQEYRELIGCTMNVQHFNGKKSRDYENVVLKNIDITGQTLFFIKEDGLPLTLVKGVFAMDVIKDKPVCENGECEESLPHHSF